MNKKKSSTHITFISNYAWTLKNFRLGLAEDIRRRGVEVEMIAEPDGHEAHIRTKGFKFHAWNLSRYGTNALKELSSIFALYGVLRKHRPIFSFNYTVKGVIYGGIVSRILGIPHAAVLTGLGYVFMRETWVAKISRRLYKLVLTWPEVVWFLNVDDRNEFVTRGLVDVSRTAVLPGEGIDLEHFSAVELADADGNITFLLIARLLWDKGIGEFVEAASDLRKRYPNTRFQLLGESASSNPTAIPSSIVESWVDARIVEYLGVTDDVRPYISKAHCVVLPSYREGIPRSLLEGAAMGRPIVTSTAIGCREMVVEGETGYLCKVGDPSSLQDAMSKIINLSAEDMKLMGQRSRDYVAERFDAEIITKKYMDLLEKVGIS
jgi:glycosyltransferase involved in cell wall biosynthesis